MEFIVDASSVKEFVPMAAKAESKPLSKLPTTFKEFVPSESGGFVAAATMDNGKDEFSDDPSAHILDPELQTPHSWNVSPEMLPAPFIPNVYKRDV